MSRRKLPANPWLRGGLVAAGVLVVGGVAFAGHDGASSTPTVPLGTVSTFTTVPSVLYSPVAPDSATPVPAPVTTTVVVPPAPATTEVPATTEAAVPPQDTGDAGGSESSGGGGACGVDYYRNSDGQCVHDPVQAPSAPSGATAECKDGTYSFSKHRSGTCSGHGGVAEWLT